MYFPLSHAFNTEEKSAAVLEDSDAAFCLRTGQVVTVGLRVPLMWSIQKLFNELESETSFSESFITAATNIYIYIYICVCVCVCVCVYVCVCVCVCVCTVSKQFEVISDFLKAHSVHNY